ncbi:DNA polymerase III epsilon subunit-like protein [Microbacteriaceae bacterium MWH-Ta3]|nr:DNA polymerase III epsilon subunit-like protein [Microbacteriaceae bacterium MWH-Ta3]
MAVSKGNWGCFSCFGVVIIGAFGAYIVQAFPVLFFLALAIVAAMIGLTLWGSRKARQEIEAFVESVHERRAYVAVDVETSGLESGDGAEIVQIALIAYDEAHTELGRFSTVVKPRGDVGPTNIHGITKAATRFAPRFDVLAVPLARLLDGSIVVAHNAAFDIGFLRAEFTRSGKFATLPRFQAIDTWPLAQRYVTGTANFKLPTCVDALGIDVRMAPGSGQHDAMYDVWCCAQVFQAIARKHALKLDAVAEWM